MRCHKREIIIMKQQGSQDLLSGRRCGKSQKKGRHLFQFRPKVNFEIAHTFQSSYGERIISQLRMGYVELNDY